MDVASIQAVAPYWRAHLADVVHVQAVANKPDVTLVTAGSGARLVLKALEPVPADRTRLEALQQLLEHLSRDGVPIALPIRNDDGAAVSVLGGVCYQLLPLLPSGPPASASEQEALPAAIGEAIGRLHRSLAGFPGDIPGWRLDLRTRILEQALPVLGQKLAPAARTRLDAAIATWLPAFSGLVSELPAQRIHGDCHHGNFLTSGGTVSGFIDLDHVPMGPRIYDCAYLIANWIRSHQVDGKDPALLGQVFAHIINAYASQIPLQARERAALPVVIASASIMLLEYFCINDNVIWIEYYLKSLEWQGEHAGLLAESTSALPP
jgi:Ser/Thr protein kinase RdoA (MazF antagonist)